MKAKDKMNVKVRGDELNLELVEGMAVPKRAPYGKFMEIAQQMKEGDCVKGFPSQQKTGSLVRAMKRLGYKYAVRKIYEENCYGVWRIESE